MIPHPSTIPSNVPSLVPTCGPLDDLEDDIKKIITIIELLKVLGRAIRWLWKTITGGKDTPIGRFLNETGLETSLLAPLSPSVFSSSTSAPSSLFVTCDKLDDLEDDIEKAIRILEWLRKIGRAIRRWWESITGGGNQSVASTENNTTLSSLVSSPSVSPSVSPSPVALLSPTSEELENIEEELEDILEDISTMTRIWEKIKDAGEAIVEGVKSIWEAIKWW